MLTMYRIVYYYISFTHCPSPTQSFIITCNLCRGECSWPINSQRSRVHNVFKSMYKTKLYVKSKVFQLRLKMIASLFPSKKKKSKATTTARMCYIHQDIHCFRSKLLKKPIRKWHNHYLKRRPANAIAQG